MKGENICFGGKTNDRHLESTIICDAIEDALIMKEEIFGPILSVQTFENMDDLIVLLNTKEKPLAVYYFSENIKNQRKVLMETTSGDAGINEVVLHFVNSNLPFGGIGASGMGLYHGKHSFDAFSHTRSIVKSTTLFDLPFRYPPYKKLHYKILRLLIK